MDLELATYFEKLLVPEESERLAKMAESLNDELFSLPDATGYSGNIAAEIENAILIEQVMGVDREGASSIASAITRERRQDQAKVCKSLMKSAERRLAVERIVAPLRQKFHQLAIQDAIQDDGYDSFGSLTESMHRYVETAVQEIRR
jgi:ribosome recycling factor